MNEALIEKIASAVLYEGYMLYPYRHSSIKNKQRWNFGVVYPRDHSAREGGVEPWQMRTECLVNAADSAEITIKLRFLQGILRQSADSVHESWQEAMERELRLPPVTLGQLAAESKLVKFSFDAGCEVEDIMHEGAVDSRVTRTREKLDGTIEVKAAECESGVYRVSVLISNLSSSDAEGPADRESVLLKSFLSTHTVLGVDGGQFISLMDPPDQFKAAAAQCTNSGTWPVLVGEENARDAMLSSPIILYDYPQIAPESPGDLFDGTEIDEILALRILTLSDSEKSEIRAAGDRAKQVLERTESLPPEHFMKLHGVLRGLRPSLDEIDRQSEERH